VYEDDGYFDERFAARYDEFVGEMFDPDVVDPVVDFLVEIAGSGRALELGIGTGRIALPLRQRGVPVHGIELSKAMVARLRAKPGGGSIGVTIGDFATTTVDGTFSVAYLVFNTIMNLTTREAQVACFRNAASHLVPSGCFLIEVMVPELRRLPPGETFHVFGASESYFGIDEYDVANHGVCLAPPHDRRRPTRPRLDAIPARVAAGARPDGRARGDAPARTLGWMEPRADHKQEPVARLGLGDGGLTSGARVASPPEGDSASQERSSPLSTCKWSQRESEEQQHLDLVASADVVNRQSPSTHEPWEAEVNG
jgi:SAM-dependent methyltransferase